MRVLLADDQGRVRFALRVLLEQMPDVVVAGEAEEAADLLEALEEVRPDLLIVDWLLPGLSGGDLLAEMRAVYPGLAIIAISGRPELEPSALANGATAFVSKIDPPERLLEAVGRFRTHLTDQSR